MDKNDRTYSLLHSFINAQLEKPQLDELFALLEQMDDKQLHVAIRSILDEEDTAEADATYIQERVQVLQQDILKKIDPSGDETTFFPRTSLKRWGLAIAATLLIACTATYLLHQRNIFLNDGGDNIAATIMPGTNKATITIGGQDFQLDSEQGELVLSTDSLYYGDGTLLTTAGREQPIHVKTPLGGQYQLTLADGSKVWLNAGSELTYTMGFGKANRMLSLKGEAYFQVVKNEQLPFIVHTHEQAIEVLGTSFNVSAYPEESLVKTTLQEGSLAVSNAIQKLTLQPNQQSVLDKGVNKINVRHVDAASIVAWKDGVFDFHGMSVEDCMRIIARWYALDVVYTEKVPSVLLGGKMSRGVKLSTFLTFLETNFNIHGEVTPERKLIITTNKP